METVFSSLDLTGTDNVFGCFGNIFNAVTIFLDNSSQQETMSKIDKSENQSNGRHPNVRWAILVKVALMEVNIPGNKSSTVSLKIVASGEHTGAPTEGQACKSMSEFVRLNGSDHGVNLLHDFIHIVEAPAFQMFLDAVEDPKVCWG